MSHYINAVGWKNPEQQDEQDRSLREANRTQAIAETDICNNGGDLYMNNMVMPQGGYMGLPSELYGKLALKNMEHQNRMEEECQKHNNKLRQVEAETKARDWLAERKFERAQARELQQEAVIADPDGYLRIQSTQPGGKAVLSDPITNVRGISLVRIISWGSTIDIQAIYCEDIKEAIYLVGKECTVKGFQKALEGFGIVVHFGRDKRREVYDLIYEYLIRNCSVRNCKYRFGWNKTEHGWQFASENEETIQTILRKHKLKEGGYEK